MPQKETHLKKRRFFKARSFWISIFLSLFVSVIYILSQPEINLIKSTGLLDLIEAKTLDIRFRLRGNRQPKDDIVIIAVDEKTDDELGRWQSSGRRWIAELVKILHKGGAKVVGFDLVLAEQDEGAAQEVIAAVKKRYIEQAGENPSNLSEMFTYLDQIKAAHDYDRQLQSAIQEAGNLVLGIYHFFDPNSASHLTQEKREAYRQIIKRAKYSLTRFPPGFTRQPLRLIHSYGVEPNLPMFSEAAKSFGHFNVFPSRDGYIRYTPLLIEYMGEYYPSLDMEMVRTYLNPPLPPIIHALGKEGGGSVDVIQIGKIRIPTDETGKLLINYYGPEYTFSYYSISDVILGKIPPETFKDKIVLLGFTSAIYQDLHSTPFQQGTFPGVEIHATIIENIIRNDFLIKPEWATPVEAFMIIVSGIVLGIILHRLNSHVGAFLSFLCLIIIAGIAYSSFLFQRIWLNVTFPFLFIILDYLVITTYKYFAEERKRKEVKHAFQHYVAPTVVDHMLETVDQLRLGGERRQMTVLFSDIRGFTSISETMEPEDLVLFLNQYLSAMTKIVMQYEGTVDKYMGDAIMAFYSAPLSQPDHAIRACKTAVDMITQLQTFRETQIHDKTWKRSLRQTNLTNRPQDVKELIEQWEAKGLWPMQIGIGINSGDMIVGNMGSAERFDYTIMGDNVNLASRLEGINKQYGTNIIISQFTYHLIKEEPFIVRELDSVRVKGKLQPVTIYELLGYGTLHEPQQEFVNAFNKGLDAYKERQWSQAITFFREASQIEPDDTPSTMYIERCTEYLKNPPPEDWDGVFVMKTK